MKRILLLALFIIIPSSIYSAGYERILTEDSSIQTALAINHDILIYAQNIEFEEQRMQESKALFFPNVELNFNLSKFNNASPMLIFGELAPTPVFLPQDNKDIYYSTRISVWQSVFSGGRIRTTNKLAKMQMNKIKNEENLIKNKVINDVKIAFNECLYYKELLKLLNAKLENVVSKKSKNEISDIERKIDIVQMNYEKKKLDLLNSIGLELNTIIDISGSFKPKIKSFDLNQCLLLAYQFKPEMQVTQYQETIDGLVVNLLSMQKYPNISIGAAQEWTGDQIIGDDTNWYISLNANIPVFDGGGAFARVKQGKINAREAALKRSKAESKVRLDVSQSFIEYNFWRKKAFQSDLLEREGHYTEEDLEIIKNINKSFYELERSVGIQLELY